MARLAKAAEKEAELIIASLARASDAAVETALNSVTEKLRQNIPLMYHINALLNNEEWTGSWLLPSRARRVRQEIPATSQAAGRRCGSCARA